MQWMAFALKAGGIEQRQSPWPLPRGGSCEHEKQRDEAADFQTAERGLADAALQGDGGIGEEG
jgi:hypothetical protein